MYVYYIHTRGMYYTVYTKEKSVNTSEKTQNRS